MTLGGLSIVSLQKCGGANIKLPPGAGGGGAVIMNYRSGSRSGSGFLIFSFSLNKF
jgi:hypothetical protein